jgi:N-acetylmuramoyl-L-alanine amidase
VRVLTGKRVRLAAVLSSIMLVLGLAGAQLPLTVNGWQVTGLRLDLLQNISYAPAAALAEALGAEIVTDRTAELVTLRMGGRTVQLRIHAAASGASAAGSFLVDGSVRDEPGAVLADGVVFLPVKALAHAFGGHITVLSGANAAVVVVLPRGVLRELDSERDGLSERLIVSLSSAVPYSVYFNEPLSVLQVRFERTESAVGAVSGSERFRHASVVADRAAAELRIVLEADTQYTVHTVPMGPGYQLVVNLTRRTEAAAQAMSPWRVVLDPGPVLAGSDPGLLLASSVAAELAQQGIAVVLSRTGSLTLPLAARAASGSGADLFLSLSISESGEGYSLYHLGDARSSELLEQAIRLNAEAALPDASDQVRRQVLLGLVPDLASGRRLAEELQASLNARSGWPAGGIREAPLRILAGAGGRGVLLELSAAGAAAPDLPALLAAGIQNALRRR